MVALKVLALHVLVPLSPAIGPDEESPDVVLRTLADHDGVARQAARLVDQGRGGGPAAGIVEHGVVQRRPDSVERGLVAHDDSASPPGRSIPYSDCFQSHQN